MASGLAGFASGLAGGLQQGFNMGMLSEKNKREAEAFALQKEKSELENDELRRKKAMQEQITRDWTALQEQIQGGVVGGEAEDEFGQPVGQVQYATPAEAKASGLKFKEGTTIQNQPKQMSNTEILKARAAIMQKARIDHGFMDEAAFERQIEINKKLKREGFEEAFQTFEETGDSSAAIDVYNKAKGGKNKAPEGSYMVKERDPMTGETDIVVYAPGPGGKPQRLTSAFEVYLASMPDKLVEYGLGMKREKFKETQANQRNAANNRTEIDKVILGNQGRAGGKKDERKELIRKIVMDAGDKILGNSAIQLDPVKFQSVQEQIVSKALKLLDEGKETDEFGAVVSARNQLGYSNTDAVTGLGQQPKNII